MLVKEIIFMLFCFVVLPSFGKYYYRTEYETLHIDHFTYANSDTFKLRYLINDTFWKPGLPIFFYTGNEGDITSFAENSGFIWELALKFNAMVVFAEHRYYGETQPYGNKSYSAPQYLGYLTSSQALADYVYLIEKIKEKHKADSSRHKSPVVAFGGSYGGMLAAWIRLKYPSTVFASLASSAPIFQFETTCGSFFNIISAVYNVSAPGGACAKNIKKSWKELRKLNSTDVGKSWLSNKWKFCKPLKNGEDYEQLVDWLKDVYGNLAMVNYPYPTNFLAELPGHPVKAMCKYLEDPRLEAKALITALGNALSVYTNFTGSSKCLNTNESISTGISEDGWNFQACTEMLMPMCNEDNDMFEKSDWNQEKFRKDCIKKFHVAFDSPHVAIAEYGGKPAPYSNVIFTNGLLDPWSAGGMLYTNLPSVYAILIPNSAHHLELRASNPADPESVISTRINITNILRSWLDLYYSQFDMV